MPNINIFKMFCSGVCRLTDTLQWRHNGAKASQIISVTIVYSTVYSRRRSKKTSKLCVTGLCEWNSLATGEFPAQRASNAEEVSILWRHHELCGKTHPSTNKGKLAYSIWEVVLVVGERYSRKRAIAPNVTVLYRYHLVLRFLQWATVFVLPLSEWHGFYHIVTVVFPWSNEYFLNTTWLYQNCSSSSDIIKGCADWNYIFVK